MGTKTVTKSLALLPLQPVKEQFPQRQTLKIARSWLHPCQPHPDEAVCEQPPPLSAHGARPLAQVTQLNGPVPVGPRPWPGVGSPGGPQKHPLARSHGRAACSAPETHLARRAQWRPCWEAGRCGRGVRGEGLGEARPGVVWKPDVQLPWVGPWKFGRAPAHSDGAELGGWRPEPVARTRLAPSPVR